VLVRVGVCEAVFKETVDEGVVAVFGTFTEGREVVGYVGHGFGAASYYRRGVAGHDCLGSKNDGLEAGGTDFIDGGADYRVREAGANRTLSGGILAETGQTV